MREYVLTSILKYQQFGNVPRPGYSNVRHQMFLDSLAGGFRFQHTCLSTAPSRSAGKPPRNGKKKAAAAKPPLNAALGESSPAADTGGSGPVG